MTLSHNENTAKANNIWNKEGIRDVLNVNKNIIYYIKKKLRKKLLKINYKIFIFDMMF